MAKLNLEKLLAMEDGIYNSTQNRAGLHGALAEDLILIAVQYSGVSSNTAFKRLILLWETGTLCITIAANIADTAILGFEACFPDSIVGFIPDSSDLDVRFL